MRQIENPFKPVIIPRMNQNVLLMFLIKIKSSFLDQHNLKFQESNRGQKTFFLVLFLLFSLFSPLNILFHAFAGNDEEELFLVAQKAFEDGFYDVAMGYINNYLEKYPQTQRRVQANLLLGQCYFFKSQYLKAYGIFEELLKYTEFKDATLFWIGETYLKGANYLQAEKYYRELINLYPESVYTPQAYYSLGWTFFDQKKYDLAIEQFQKLIDLFPTHPLVEDSFFKLSECAYNQTNYQKAVDYFKDYVVKFPQSTRLDQVFFYIGEAYYYLQDFSSAISYYSKTVETSTDNKLISMSKISLGWCYLKTKDFENSQKFFVEALALSEEKGVLLDDIYLGQASLFTELEQNEKALEAYQKLIDQFPNSSRMGDAYLGKANSLYSIKNYSDAIVAYQMVIEKFASSEEGKAIVEKARFGLAWSYLKAGDIDLSIQSFQEIMDQTQNKIVKISALTQIGDAYQDAGKLEKAIEIYDRVLQDYPDSLYTDYVQYREAVGLLKMDKIEPATIALKTLKENFPESKYLNEANYYLGLAYFKKGDWPATIEQIESFIETAPKSNEFLPDANYILALSNFNFEKYDKANKVFQQIVKIFPGQLPIVRDSEVGIAKCIYNLGDSKEAVKKFKIIIYKYPKTDAALDSLMWLGDYYFESSSFENAISYYQQVLDDFPGSDKLNLARFGLGQVYLGQEEYDKAINQLKLIDDPKDKELYAKAKLAIADIFSKELDSQNAIQAYQNIAMNCPDFKRDALVKIADLHKANQSYDEAINFYQQALELDAGMSKITDTELLFSIADIYETINQLDQAIESYLKIPYLHSGEIPWVTKAYLRVARIFEGKGDWQNAIVIYEKVIALGTDEVKFAEERLDWIKNNTQQAQVDH